MTQQLQAELNYQAARLTIKRMVEAKVISVESARRLEDKIISQYQPVIGGFFHDVAAYTNPSIPKEEDTLCNDSARPLDQLLIGPD